MRGVFQLHRPFLTHSCSPISLAEVIVSCSMSLLSAIIAACALGVSFAALLVQSRRARIMKEQLATQRAQIADLERTRSLQEMRILIRDLLDIRKSIETVLALEGKNLSEWTEGQREAAFTVSGRFSLLGILVLERLVPEDVFAKAWYYSVPKCYAILRPFLEEIRSQRDYRYWSAFDVLAQRIADSTKDFPGFFLKT